MKLLKINYSLNKEYFVAKEVFNEIIKKSDLNTKLSKVIDSKIDFFEKTNDFKIELKIKIKKNQSIKKIIFELQNEIEKYSFNLINSKPKNILFFIEGEM